eukprot:GHVR01107094.1.p1 GENE.GHVR01107094.1~~GHVR01107094.1.p1  ORF type:complete len:180 (+),score=29.06 GHVR01107094.1:74-613(+)
MKKFTMEDVSTQYQMKSSLQRGVRAKVIEQYPLLESVIDSILPKKAVVVLAKCKENINFVVVENKPLFFQHRDGPWVPTLRLLHLYPTMMPRFRVDKGGIKNLLKGANLMCQGLTSKGGSMENANRGSIVSITGEGKLHAFAIGQTTMSIEEIKEVNKGVCLNNLHFLGDGLWNLQSFE